MMCAGFEPGDRWMKGADESSARTIYGYTRPGKWLFNLMKICYTKGRRCPVAMLKGVFKSWP